MWTCNCLNYPEDHQYKVSRKILLGKENSERVFLVARGVKKKHERAYTENVFLWKQMSKLDWDETWQKPAFLLKIFAKLLLITIG